MFRAAAFEVVLPYPSRSRKPYPPPVLTVGIHEHGAFRNVEKAAHGFLPGIHHRESGVYAGHIKKAVLHVKPFHLVLRIEIRILADIYGDDGSEITVRVEDIVMVFAYPEATFPVLDKAPEGYGKAFHVIV